jgi:transposase-like protein
VAQYDRVLDALADKLPEVAEHLDAARAELLAVAAFLTQIWHQMWLETPERVNKDPPRHGRRRHFRLPRSHHPSRRRLLAEHHDEWMEAAALGLDMLARAGSPAPRHQLSPSR